VDVADKEIKNRSKKTRDIREMRIGALLREEKHLDSLGDKWKWN